MQLYKTQSLLPFRTDADGVKVCRGSENRNVWLKEFIGRVFNQGMNKYLNIVTGTLRVRWDPNAKTEVPQNYIFQIPHPQLQELSFANTAIRGLEQFLEVETVFYSRNTLIHTQYWNRMSTYYFEEFARSKDLQNQWGVYELLQRRSLRVTTSFWVTFGSMVSILWYSAAEVSHGRMNFLFKKMNVRKVGQCLLNNCVFKGIQKNTKLLNPYYKQKSSLCCESSLIPFKNSHDNWVGSCRISYFHIIKTWSKNVQFQQNDFFNQ